MSISSPVMMVALLGLPWFVVVYSRVAVDVWGDDVGQREAAVAGQRLRGGELGLDLEVRRLEALAGGAPLGGGVGGRVEGPHAGAAVGGGAAGAALKEGQARRHVLEHGRAGDGGGARRRGQLLVERRRREQDDGQGRDRLRRHGSCLVSRCSSSSSGAVVGWL